MGTAPETGRAVRRPGDGPRPTMADVARAAGLSTALVSIVMRGVPGASEATRARVLGIAEQLGYVPDQRARKLRQSRSRLLGITFELQQAFHGDLVEQFYRAAAERGYDVSLSAVAPTRDEPTAVDALLRERCEAVILVGSRLDDPAIARIADRVPTLVVARRCDAPGVGVVRGDDLAGIALAVDHLVELGHRQIAHVDGADAPGSEERRTGFLAAMARHGLVEGAEVLAGGLTEEAGAHAMWELLDRPTTTTGVVAVNDRCAAGVLTSLVHRGRAVPGDVSVVGYDDSRLAQALHVQMTTISQNAGRLADVAIDEAIRLVAGEEPTRTVLTPELVRRSTTGPARQL
jgi:DNA-binding LacI/PurR family transcriptional regulator